jgi:lipopolysaccharide heptosyltransferase II
MPDTIVVMLPNWLGDAVMALPAVGAVRHHHPEDRLVVAARRSVAGLFRMVPGVDDVVSLDGGGGWRGAAAWRAEAHAMAGVHADLAVLLPNSFRSAWTAREAGIPRRWGYAADWRTPLLTRRVEKPRGRLHQADYYLALVSALGMPVAGDPATIVLPDEVARRAAALLLQHGIAGDRLLVGMAPGAAYGGAKQWPPERFARVARLLYERHGVVSLLVGSGADRSASLRIDAGEAAVDLVGQTDLPLLVGVLARCRAFVSNDSGAMHLAAALGLPVTAVFGPTDERGTAPRPSGSASAAPHEILTSNVWCRPCMLRECPFDHRCMTGIDPEPVLAAVERQIASRISSVQA